jgi:hypothetical protein
MNKYVTLLVVFVLSASDLNNKINPSKDIFFEDVEYSFKNANKEWKSILEWLEDHTAPLSPNITSKINNIQSIMDSFSKNLAILRKNIDDSLKVNSLGICLESSVLKDLFNNNADARKKVLDEINSRIKSWESIVSTEA